jgi:hypothetical protein
MKMTRLDLYQFDDSPMNPMFLAYSPPQMLPTVTMNPTSSTPSATGNSKRDASDEFKPPLNKDAVHIRRGIEQPSFIHRVDLNTVWWAGVGMIIFGGTAYLLQ